MQGGAGRGWLLRQARPWRRRENLDPGRGRRGAEKTGGRGPAYRGCCDRCVAAACSAVFDHDSLKTFYLQRVFHTELRCSVRILENHPVLRTKRRKSRPFAGDLRSFRRSPGDSPAFLPQMGIWSGRRAARQCSTPHDHRAPRKTAQQRQQHGRVHEQNEARRARVTTSYLAGGARQDKRI